MIKTAIVGLGFMGQTHFNCYKNNPLAQVVAVGGRDLERLNSGAKVAGNIETNAALDLSGVQTTTDIAALIRDPAIDLIDCCLPTRQHAQFCIAALNAGKHVLCEKPLAWTVAECDAIIEAQGKSGKFLLVGQCLRFWPQYVEAHRRIQSGALGTIVYARLMRTSGAPNWSRWLMDGAQSGGVALDMHVHDIDTALWWFGEPTSIQTTGLIRDGLPLVVDASWNYEGGPQVHLHGGWDANGSDFAMAFEIVGSRASLRWDSSQGEAMQLHRDGRAEQVEVAGPPAYQAEIDYLLECIDQHRAPARITPQSSRLSVKLARQELAQLGFEN